MTFFWLTINREVYWVVELNDQPMITRLTKRELQIAKLLADGFNSKDISERLHISVETVHSHKKNMLSKSDSKNSVMLVARCIKSGLI